MLRQHKKSSDKRNPTFLESECLRQEIEDLEDALILHARFQAESDNSVKQMIRKELGSTHWEHGGEGKLRTYRSGKDLCNQGMVMNPFLHKKAKDKKKWQTGSDGKNDDKPKRDNRNSNAVMCTTADKKVRMVKKIKSTSDKKEQRDVASDVEDIFELKITRIKTTPVIDESPEMTFDTADVNQDAIIKTLNLKDEVSITRKEKSCPRKANYSNKLNINKVENKYSKASSHTSLSESSKVSNTCNLTAKEIIKSGTKMVHKKPATPLFISDADDNFVSGIQPSSNNTDTNNVITKCKLNTQELYERIDVDKTLMLEMFNHTNVPDNKTFVNEQYNEYEYSRSKTFVENECHKRNSSGGSSFLSSKQDQGAVNKDKWAVTNNALLYIDSDCIGVPCNNSCTDDDSGDFYTDFEALEGPQIPQYEGYEHTPLSAGDSVKKDEQKKEMNMFSTESQAVPVVQSSVTNCTADNVNTCSELASSPSHCLNCGLVNAESMQALSVTQHSSVCGKPSSLPETDSPQGRSSHHVDVETWLHSLGLEPVEHYIQLFHDHQMDMSRVQLLSATDLREMGIHAIGPIMKIMKGVLVLGRDNGLLSGSCDYTNNGGKESQNWDPAARSMDNHTERFDLTEMSTKFNHALNNDTKNNNMCKIEHGRDKTFSRAPSSAVLHTKEPGQNGVINNSGDNTLAKLDLGTTTDVKISDDGSVAVHGVTRVGDGMLKESSRPKHTVNRRQLSAKRRGKQPVVGVCDKPPINSNGIAVAADKFRMKEKQLRVKEANRRSMMRQKQLQDSEFNRVSVGQNNEKDGLDTSLFTVFKVQSDLSVPEPNLKKLQQSCLEQTHLEPPRCLKSVELSQTNNCHSDSESSSFSSSKRRNEQKKKQRQNITRQNIVNEEERSISVKANASDDNETHKLSTASSLYRDQQLTRELPDQGNLNRREPVNDLFKEENDNFICRVTIGGDVDATDTAEIKKDTSVVDQVPVMTATTHLLKSQKLGHPSVKNKYNCHLRVQQSRQPEKCKISGLSHSYILDNFKKVELNRDDVVFSETDLLGSGTFSQVFKGTYMGSEVAVKRLQTPLQKRDLNYFVSEISDLQELRHPHVAMLLGVCSRHVKCPLIVMEFLPCGSLHTWLHGRTNLQRFEFYQIAHDVSSGMLYLHQHKPQVLHLDLRPRNILIGLGVRAKVADFGFSKLRFKNDVKRHHTRESPTWMAPELFTSGEITPKADVYSFGMVLWEMLTRQCPFDSFSMFQILECLQASRRPTLPSDCPKGLSEIVQKCWDQNPAARPGFKEVLKRLELLSQTHEWINSAVENPEHENLVISLNFKPEYSKVVEYNLKKGLLKAEEKTSNTEHIDVISLSSQENEESNSYHDLDEMYLGDPKHNYPERSRFCDIISLAGSASDLQEFSNRKNSVCSTDDEQPKLLSQLSCRSSRSCLSLPDNEKDNEKMRHSTADQLKEMYLASRKSSISISKSEDSLRSSTSVKKLLPLRNSLDPKKVMPASYQSSGFTTPNFLNIKTKGKAVHHFLDADKSGRLCKHVDTNSASVTDPALVSPSWLAKGHAIVDPISANEDVLLATCSEALLYVPSFHNKVTPVRPIPRQEPSGINEACCQQSLDEGQNSNHLKKSLSCSHVGTQPVSIFMNTQNKNQNDASIKANTVISGSGSEFLGLGSNKSCSVHVMNKDSQVNMLSLLGQTTNFTESPNTHESKQVEAERCHLSDSNIPHEKGNLLENSHSLTENRESLQIKKRHDVGWCSLDPAREETVHEPRLEPSNTVLTSQDACLSTYLCKSISDSSIEIPSARCSNFQTTTRSSTIQTVVVGCDNSPMSSRSDEFKISASSSNIQTAARSSTIETAARSGSTQTDPTGSDDIPISSRSGDTNSSNIRTSKQFSNIQIVSDGSDNIPVSLRSDDTQTPKGSSNIRTSTRSSSIQTLTRSNNIQIASAESDISVSSRFDEAKISASDYIKPFTKSADILTHSARTCNSPIPIVISENVQIHSARSDCTQTVARLGETCGFRTVADCFTELNNYSTSRINEHETRTSYESDSDSSPTSDISQDSLNIDAAACPREVNSSDHSDLTRYSSNALVMNADIILKKRVNELPISDNMKTGNFSAYNPCLTANQEFNAHHARLQSEQKNTIQFTEVCMSSIDAEAIKYNKMHNIVDDHSSGCLSPKVRESCHSQSLELTKSCEKTPQKECIVRRKQKSNISESKKDQQLQAARHNQMASASIQKRHFLTDLQSVIGAHASNTTFMLHHLPEAKDVLSLYSKQKLKHSEGTSRFSIEASMLRNQKKLLKPVVTTASSFSANTLNDTEDGPPTVITILKKAMADRRFAIGDLQESQDFTPGTSWSLES